MLKLHEGLRKAESALLIQARTGRTGLAKFLYGRSVPGFITATCQCRAGHETLCHMALYCTYIRSRQEALPTCRKKPDLHPDGEDERRGKALRTMDDVFGEATAVCPS
jgi:hypothetical protein